MSSTSTPAPTPPSTPTTPTPAARTPVSPTPTSPTPSSTPVSPTPSSTPVSPTPSSTSGCTALPPLQIGRLAVWPPVVLAPMAGVTNAPFRRLCWSFGTSATPTGSGRPDPLSGSPSGTVAGGLYVSEMITARGLAERNAKTLRMARFAADEPVRSIQLYGTDPHAMAEAVRFLVDSEGADHIDLNFGCPVAKVTRKGGGAALPVRRALFSTIVRAATRAAGDVPVTVKLRIGIDDQLRTFLDAGIIAQDEGAAAVALHARTAAQHYSGSADWSAITELRTKVTGIPVLGNGDIWRPSDALAMLRETGCDGVVVGRGCLGRPWMFRDLALAATGETPPGPPRLAEVVAALRRHAHLLAEWLTEPLGLLDLRKHVGWYLQGYPVGGQVRRQLMSATDLATFESELARLDPDITPLPGSDALPRGKTSGPQRRVVLPDGWVAHRDDPGPAVEDDLAAASGG